MSLAKIIASIILVVSPAVIASTQQTLTANAPLAQQLPLPPLQLIKTYPQGAVIELNNAQALMTEFNQKNYQLESVINSRQLPPYFVENLPANLNDLPVQQKISLFIRLLLPTIKAVNQQILTVRSQVIKLAQKPKSQWSAAEQDWLQGLFDSYVVKSTRIDDLLLQLDIVPSGMVLAQAIDESGWGSSYFAVAGNNLYGEHLSASGGEYLTTPGGRVKVAAFANLYQSTASYMHNLNTTLAYQELRLLRKQLRAQDKLNGEELVQALTHYSTRGEAYVDNLRALIKLHGLDDFNAAKLTDTASIRYRFSTQVK
ncbi:glucosaminidase domain-containing protein [Shewanella sp. 1CM18E]|uniref:glucosaminidase domain-containing protein n=1 Tax=Shewanella sp. 1CM18E TaxID=2929169 RepID=UPI0020C04CDF|nr:glucosaminidase domain-containing protein [Shewanella sp. 1CM18E]MCK8044579.1 glucosaminidase domain-containing protein [Shewanella sp. 1CM18E]